MRQFLNIISLLVFVWAILLQVNPVKTTDLNYLFNIGFAIIFFVGAWSSLCSIYKLKTEGNPKNTLILLGTSLLSYGIGLVIWTYYIYAYNLEVPYPGLPDLFFSLFYPLLLLAVLNFLKLFSFLVTDRIKRESIYVGIFLSILIVIIFGTKIDMEVSFLENFLNFYYPISSAFLISASILLARVSGGTSTSISIWLSLGLISHGLAAVFFTIRSSVGTYWNGDFTDVLFAASAFLISKSAILMIESLTPPSKRQ